MVVLEYCLLMWVKMLKNVKKGLLYAENSEKSLFFGKFHTPHHPLNFFSDRLRGWKPPTPNPSSRPWMIPTQFYIFLSGTLNKIMFQYQ